MRLQLTPEEQQLYDGLQVEPHDHETWVEVGRRMVPLMRSLAAKGAIPEARARYFLDADFNPGDTRSRRDVFVGNGCRTDKEIFGHPHFLKYLRYFVEGPGLPAERRRPATRTRACPPAAGQAVPRPLRRAPRACHAP